MLNEIKIRNRESNGDEPISFGELCAERSGSVEPSERERIKAGEGRGVSVRALAENVPVRVKDDDLAIFGGPVEVREDFELRRGIPFAEEESAAA